MRTTLVLLQICWCLSAWGAGPEVIPLWPGMPPGDSPSKIPERPRMSPALERKQVEVTEPTRMITDVTKPSISIYRPEKDDPAGTAVLICPGGGYWNLYWELEGEEVAAWLNSLGVTGVILKYRVPRTPDEPKTEPARRPLQDAQRAMRLLRSKAADLGIRHIGTMGFSAGGHLAMATAANFDSPAYAPMDEVDKLSSRPDFAVPVYSGYFKMKEKEELVPGWKFPTNTPPVFLVHGSDDIVSPPENSVLMYLALKRAGIPAELHVYADTTHDFGARKAKRPYAKWTDACAEWLRDRGMLSK